MRKLTGPVLLVTFYVSFLPKLYKFYEKSPSNLMIPALLACNELSANESFTINLSFSNEPAV